MPDSIEQIRADVCVIGGGLIGLCSALQFAKRGLSVTCVDQPTEKQRGSYKVGESLLIYSNAFLRAICDLDKALTESFVKGGFWMAYGLEGRSAFDENVSEWGFQNRLPKRWVDNIKDQFFVRTMFGDAQIVRPEIEAVLRDRIRETAGLTYLDRGLVREVEIGAGDADHVLVWSSRDRSESGRIRARWIIDCSGRSRFLARLLGHDLPLDDDFSTTAAWAQFSGCTDDLFDERWEFTFPDGEVIRRDLDTVHLWGDGYWIWLIRLTGDRISVGVNYHRGRAPELGNAREVFWKVLRRYPVLDFLTEDNVLEFGAYRDVQYLTDTYVSPRRYALAGDAASIIDGYYSQGISLSLATAWHAANIAQRDIREGNLDRSYIEHVNRATSADWRILRSMVRAKYGPAIADSRFFILDHLLDYMVFGAALLGRYRISRWLAETGGRTDEETYEHARLRTGLTRRLFLSQSAPWHRLDPDRVAGIIERWHRGLERRALWRLEHGVQLPPTKAGLRAHAALPGVWRLPYLTLRSRADLTLRAIKEPEFMRVKGTEKRPVIFAGSGAMLLIFNMAGTLIDILDTRLRRVRSAFRRIGRPSRRLWTHKNQGVSWS